MPRALLSLPKAYDRLAWTLWTCSQRQSQLTLSVIKVEQVQVMTQGMIAGAC